MCCAVVYCDVLDMGATVEEKGQIERGAEEEAR